MLGDDSCSDSELCYVEADTHDDGAKSGKFDDTIKLDLQEVVGTTDADTRDAEFEIDFQAFVMDMAGNIGFSDSDISNPRFINDLGEKEADRKVPNVLGYYSAHVFTLDEKDPEIIANQSVTGFYGIGLRQQPEHRRPCWHPSGVRRRAALQHGIDQHLHGDA